MSQLGSAERKVKVLQIAASMTRRLSKDDSLVAASELVKYATTLDTWVTKR